MWIVRAVKIDDLDALFALVQSATRGLTTLQLDRNRLLDRIEQSVFAFSRTGTSPRGEPYVLVLTNDETGELVGTSTVYTKTGGYQPFYAYQITHSEHHSELLNISHTRTSLQLQRIHDGPSEIGSLFLRGIYRGEGWGRWLSLSRFALIAMRPGRFADGMIAEMRGRQDSDGRVPFYEAIAQKFIPVDFNVVDTMSTISKQFIEEMMPMHPIYLDLLPQEIRDGIGKVHRETEPALKLLKSEGFSETDLVDIFDGGPVVRCETKQINAVRRTQPCQIAKIADQPLPGRSDTILSSDANEFTSVLTAVSSDGDQLTIDRNAALALSLDVGSTCYTMPSRPEMPSRPKTT
ncbi:arginine N-succinyltransferase [Planctomycetes bacterium K23_9]|uniref:Arginine N-succinyltransferase n=1 Tax=Stieleria marina TaxID=1930275 RepID=A0A517P3C8_9BACT|nr:Arginine N-succinyltransferase [Planctomycetes bacterium K23_9]